VLIQRGFVMRDIYENIIGFIIGLSVIGVITLNFTSLLFPTNHSPDKILNSCKLMGAYYFEENKAIKCEVVEK
jgi:hypothetical protein